MPLYELKLSDGRTVTQDARIADEAVSRYARNHPAVVIIAWRHAERHGMRQGLGRIIEPDQDRRPTA